MNTQESVAFDDEEQFVIWNGSFGVADTVTIGRVELNNDSKEAWLEEPYGMVGPFSFDTLYGEGVISFAKCIVMTKAKWREEQDRLREESLEKRAKAQREMFEELNRANARRQRGMGMGGIDERAMRELLCLPMDGHLEVTQIKAAYKKVAKTAHPDVGGSHEVFVEIAQARDTLVELYSEL